MIIAFSGSSEIIYLLINFFFVRIIETLVRRSFLNKLSYFIFCITITIKLNQNHWSISHISI